MQTSTAQKLLNGQKLFLLNNRYLNRCSLPKKRQSAFRLAVFFMRMRTRTHLNATRRGRVAADGLTEAHNNFRQGRKCKSSPPPATRKTKSTPKGGLRFFLLCKSGIHAPTGGFPEGSDATAAGGGKREHRR